jgi:hypothetical protein
MDSSEKVVLEVITLSFEVVAVVRWEAVSCEGDQSTYRSVLICASMTNEW